MKLGLAQAAADLNERVGHDETPWAYHWRRGTEEDRSNLSLADHIKAEVRDRYWMAFTPDKTVLEIDAAIRRGRHFDARRRVTVLMVALGVLKGGMLDLLEIPSVLGEIRKLRALGDK